MFKIFKKKKMIRKLTVEQYERKETSTTIWQKI